MKRYFKKMKRNGIPKDLVPCSVFMRTGLTQVGNRDPIGESARCSKKALFKILSTIVNIMVNIKTTYLSDTGVLKLNCCIQETHPVGRRIMISAQPI